MSRGMTDRLPPRASVQLSWVGRDGWYQRQKDTTRPAVKKRDKMGMKAAAAV